MNNIARMAAHDSVENGERARPGRRSTRLASNPRGGCDRIKFPPHAQRLAVGRWVRANARRFARLRAHLDTTTGALAVLTSLSRGGLENSRVLTPDKLLRTGTVR